MKHYYLVQWQVWIAGFGHSEEKEGLMTVLATSATEALDMAKKELATMHPQTVSSVTEVVRTVGY